MMVTDEVASKISAVMMSEFCLVSAVAAVRYGGELLF